MTRRATSMRHLLILLAAAVPFALGCAPQDPPVAPTFSPSRPPPTPPAPPPRPEAALAFPALSRPGEIYVESGEIYSINIPFHGGRPVSRFVLYDDGVFALQFSSYRQGFFQYYGKFTRANSRVTFSFDANNGSWQAMGTQRGDTLVVAYNTTMQWDDFNDGTYTRAR